MKRKHLLLTLLLALFLPWGAMAQNECPVVTGLNVNDVTSNGATIVWDDNGDDDFTIMAGQMYFTNYYLFDFLGEQFPNAFTHSDSNYGFVKAYDDRDCAKSNNGGHHSTTAEMVLDVTIPIESSLSFNARVSSEQDYDKAYFSIDGTVQEQLNGISGEGIWYAYGFTLPAGSHTLRWYYTKDVSVDSNDDCFYVTDISISSYVVNEWNSYEQAHSPYTITDLATSTEYYVKVIRNCTDGSHSSDGYVGSFTTLPCQAPTDLEVIALTTEYFRFQYCGLEGGVYQYAIDKADSEPHWYNGNISSPLIADGCPSVGYPLVGFEPNTDYIIRVRRICGEDDYSESATATFRTLDQCAAIPSLSFYYSPYSWSFEDVEGINLGDDPTENNLPTCWDYINTSSDETMKYYPVISYSSQNNFLFFSSMYAVGGCVDPQPQYAVLPPVEDVSILKMSFRAKTITNFRGTFSVGVMEGMDASTFEEIVSFDASTSFQDYTVTFENYTGTGKRIAIMGVAADDSHRRTAVSIDDIVLELNCDTPTDLIASNVTSTTADLSWTGSPADESYTVRYRTAPVYGTPAFSEGFENGLDYWEFHSGNEINGLNGDEGVHAGISDYTAHSRRYSFRFSSFRPIGEGETKQQSLYSPVFSLDAPNVFSFYCRNQMSDDNGYEILRIDYRSTDETIHTLATIYPSSEWQRYSFEIPADAKQVRFEYLDGMRFVYIDDITVSKMVASYGEWQYDNDIAVTSTTLSGLTLGTEYEAQVKSDCSDEWSQAVSFATQGCTYPVPSTWDFDDVAAGQMPQCWSRIGVNSTWPKVMSYYTYSGSRDLEFYHASADETTQIAVMPAFDADLNTLMVEFYGKQTYGDEPAWIEVGYVTDQNDAESFHWTKSFYMTDTYDKYTAFFNNAPTDGYIAFKTTYLNQQFAIVVDDVTVKELSCQAVTNLQYTETGSDYVVLEWEGQENAGFYIYYTNLTTQERLRTPGTVRPPYTLEGLSSNTSYQIEVTAECNVVNSNPADPNLVATLQVTTQPCTAPTDLAVSNVTAATADLSWTSSPSADSYRVAYRTAAVGEGTPLVEQGFENGMGGWLIGQETAQNETCAGIAAEAKRSGDYGFKLAACEGTYQAGQPSDALLFGTEAIDQPTVLKFYYKKGTASSSAYLVFLYYTEQHGTQPQYLVPTDDWQSYTVELPDDLVGIEIDYVLNEDDPSASVYIDDITFTPLAQAAGEWQYVENIETTSYTLIDLTVNTEYEAKVLSDCTTPDLWTLLLLPSVFFTTTSCTAPTNVAVSDITPNSAQVTWTGASDSYTVEYREVITPAFDHLTYDFEDGTFQGWTTISNDNDNYAWTIESTFEAHHGSYCARARYTSSVVGGDANDWLISPQIPLGGSLSFYAKRSTGSNQDRFQVYVSTTGNNISDFTAISEVITLNATYDLYEYDLSSYSGYGYVAIVYTAPNDLYFIYVDDITITAYAEGEYGEWQPIDNAETPQTISNLTPETTYQVRVKGNCAGAETDYSDVVSFTTIEACSTPSEFAVGEVTAHTAAISWNGGNAESWTVFVKKSTETDYPASGEVVTTPAKTFASLDAATTYDVKIEADCDDTKILEVAEAFTTECDVFTVDLANTFTEGFEGTTFAPICWDNIPSGIYQWSRGTSANYGYNHTGSGSAFSDYYGPIYLMMPDIQISSEVDGAQLSFWSYNIFTDDYDKNSVVLLNGENETELWSPESVSESWVETTIDLSSYVGQTISLAFKYEGNNAHGWYVDDVEVSLAVTQDIELSNGWNWWAPVVQITATQLNNALNNHLQQILSKEDTIGLDSEDALNPGQMYRLQVDDDVTGSVTGAIVAASINIESGANWIGYTGGTTNDISAALITYGITPVAGDKIVSQDGGFAIYNGTIWQGTLTQLVQGQGYVYVR